MSSLSGVGGAGGDKYQYRYSPGNYGDVIKHVIFIQLIKEIQKKSPDGIVLVDTHSGEGIYDVSTQSPPEYRKGVCCIIEKAAAAAAAAGTVPTPVQDYVDIVSKGNDEEFVWYPGSPILGHTLLRKGIDDHRLCDMNLEEVEVLRGKADFEQGDAFHPEAVEYLHPTDVAGKTKLILIDPSFEDGDDYYQAKLLVERILERDPTTCVMLWAPLVHGSRQRYSYSTSLKELGKQKAKIGRFYASLTVKPADLQGAAVAIFNPPPQFDDVVDDECMDWLSKALKQGPRSDFVVEQFMKKKKIRTTSRPG